MRITFYHLSDYDFQRDIVVYIQNLPLRDDLKAAILDDKFLKEILPLYTKYPSLFCQAFAVEDHIKPLNIAGFLYHRSIIYLDKLLDHTSNNTKEILLATICQEESIKILATIFPLESVFWKIWNKRRTEYLQGYHIDMATHEVLSVEDFEFLADCKSAFGKISIDCLYILSGEKSDALYQTLLQSHRYFYCALQILDDINDLREDFEHGQFNIVILELKKALDIRGISFHKATLTELAKYAFIFGVSEKLMLSALDYLDKSIHLAMQYPDTEEWTNEICCAKNMALTKMLNVKAFMKMSIAELNLSNTKLIRNDTTKAISLASSFISKMQNNDGSWNEYFNEAGTSDTWATSFIVYFLSQTDEMKLKFATQTSAGKHFLIESTRQGLWGYNKEWIPDSDSTVFARLALSSFNDQFAGSEYEWLFEYQTSDGGISTYNSPEHILASLSWRSGNKNLNGWLASHFCVSVVAYYFLKKIRCEQRDELSRLERYLITKLRKPELANAYWWTSPIYPAAFLTKVWPLIEHKELKSAINEFAQFVVSAQLSDGSYDNSPFYTGLIIDSFSEVPQFRTRFDISIQRARHWLLANQTEDGSWPNSHAMRMPAPHLKYPSNEQWPVSNRGVNIRAQEFNRLFSTTVSLSALMK